MKSLARNKKAVTKKVMDTFMVMILGVALYPVLRTFIANSNATGAQLLLVDLLGIIWIILVVNYSSKQLSA